MKKNESENQPPQDQCSELLARPSLLKDRFMSQALRAGIKPEPSRGINRRHQRKSERAPLQTKPRKNDRACGQLRPGVGQRGNKSARTGRRNQAADESSLKENPPPATVLIREPSAGE
jgi:hypothetical protein